MASTVEKVHAPLATKPSSLTQYYVKMECTACGVPPLEELVNEVFLDEIGKKDRSSVASEFVDFVTKAHCEENLGFLVEIYKYEAYYSDLFGCGKLSHITKGLGTLPVRVPRTRTTSRRSCSRTPSFDDPNMMFVSTIDDLEPQNMTQAWETFRSTVESDDDKDSDIDEPSLRDLADESAANAHWQYIIQKYISSEAPDQVNISQQLYSEIMAENAKPGPHPPVVFANTQAEVFSLLRETAYVEFTRKKRIVVASLEKPAFRRKKKDCECSSPSPSLSNLWGHLRFSPSSPSSDEGERKRFWRKKARN